MDSEKTDWLSQYGAVRKEKKGIFSFIKTVLLRRSERKVRDVNDLDAGDCIRRFNLVFGIDSDNPGAAARRVRLPVDDSSLRDVVDFTPSDSGNRPTVETEYYYAPSAPAAVPTSSMAESMPVEPFPFEVTEEPEEADPYTQYLREKYGSEEPAAEAPAEETVTEEIVTEAEPEVAEEIVEETVPEFPDYMYDLEMDSAEFSDVRAEEFPEYVDSAPAEIVQTSIDDPTFDVPDAPVSAEPIIVRQDFLDVQFEEVSEEDVPTEMAEGPAEEPGSFAENVPAEESAADAIQMIEAPAEYAVLSAPNEVPALEAPQTEPVLAIEASDEVPMLTYAEPVAAVCAPAEQVCLPEPAVEVAEEEVAEEMTVDEDIEAHVYAMQTAEPVTEPVHEADEDPVGFDMFGDYMEIQDAAEAEIPVSETVTEVPVIEEITEEPVIEETPAEVAEEPVAEEIVQAAAEAEALRSYVESTSVEEVPVIEEITEEPAVEETAEVPEIAEEPVIEMPVIEEPAVEEIAEVPVEVPAEMPVAPVAVVPASGISFRFGSVPFTAQSSGIRFAFGTASDRTDL